MSDSACHKCRHFSTGAHSDYYVGLEDFHMACLENRFRIDEPLEFENLDVVREALAKGDNCPVFEPMPPTTTSPDVV